MNRKLFFALSIFSIVLTSCSSNVSPTATSALPTAEAISMPLMPPVFKGSHDGAEENVEADCHAYGWITDANQPEKDVQVRVQVDGETVAQSVADVYRLDLAAFNRCEGGTCAFDIDLWGKVTPDKPHTVLVQALNEFSNTWVDIGHSPHTLTCIPSAANAPMAGEAKTTTDPSGRVKFQVGQNYLILEFLEDDLLHFELSGVETQTNLSGPLHTTPMVAKKDYPGPSQLKFDGEGTFETTDLKVRVEPSTLCLTAWDITRQPALILTTLCPLNLGVKNQGVTLTPESFANVYGLGEQFLPPDTQGDWVGRARTSGSFMGNAMGGWDGGAVGNAQFPVAYFLGEGLDNYALFADNAYAQTWDLKKEPWQVSMKGDWMRFYLMSGPNLQDLRQDYLDLVGHPLAPPKKMFGLWVSEYGYDNWGELDDKLRTLRANHFPVDGFVLDLQWFGGIRSGSDDSPMGSLDWDLVNFPNPAGKIAELEQNGVGIMTIEESYISRGLPEYTKMAEKNYLERSCSNSGCPPSYLTSNPWWGQGGMLDWTNPDGAAFWHDWKREPLIEAGVMGHWTDLGEPEMYDPNSWYFGITDDYVPLEQHEDIHNLFNLLWSKSIYDGYLRNGHDQRPFILSRSGAPGSQRYGVSIWSGDIGSNLTSLTSQMRVQANMSLSGMDYFGSDIGGFHRGGLDGDLNEMYTQWFANSSLLEVPVRAHTENLCNCKETAPDRIGDLESNLANIRLRYELSPYLYSLSHRAYLAGEPVFPPLVYYYQNDPAARDIVDEKMIGQDLLLAQSATYGLKERGVYFPAGDWYDYYTDALYHSDGEQLGPFPLYQNGNFQLPLFARSGAIIPQMYVDDQTMNILGQRIDGSVRNELTVRVYASSTETSFTLYEDDGATIAYQNGEVRSTLLSQQQMDNGARVIIAASQGEYEGAPPERVNVVMLVMSDADEISQVSLNGESLPQMQDQSAWEEAVSGWYLAGDNLIMAKSSSLPVSIEKVFEFRQ